MLSDEWAAGEHSVDILDKKGLINIQSKMEQDGSKFHHATQHDLQYKIY